MQLTVVLFTIAHPLALIGSTLWLYLHRRREGAIALPPDEERRVANGTEGPAQVDVEAIWG